MTDVGEAWSNRRKQLRYVKRAVEFAHFLNRHAACRYRSTQTVTFWYDIQ
jgi:hypothetical protein